MEAIPLCTIDEMKEGTLKDLDFMNNLNPEPKMFKISATISRIMSDRPLFYESCPECKKKVTPNDHSNGFYCERCQKAFERCKYHYNFTLRLSDFSGTIYGQVMGDNPGDSLMEMSAEDLKQVQDELRVNVSSQIGE